MTNLRAIVLLSLGVGVMTAGNLLLTRSGSSHAVPDRESLVDVSSSPIGLTVSRAGQPPVVLEKLGGWRLTSPYSGSADQQAVLRLLDALSVARIDDCMTDAELLRFGKTRRDFGLDPASVSLVVRTAGGEQRVSFGSRTPTGTGLYAAVSGADAVFVVPTGTVALASLTADAFRRRSLFPDGAESVSSFDIKRGTGSLLPFVRVSGGWKVGNETASDHKVRQLLDVLSGAKAEEFVWPVGATNESPHATASLLAGYGLEPESAVTVTLKGLEGSDRQVSFGKEAGDRFVYALIQNGTAIAKVPAVLKDAAVQDPVMFTDSRLFPVDATSVTSLRLSDGGVNYSLSREKDGVWRLDSPIAAPADASAVDALLSRILALSPADGSSDGISVSLGSGAAPVLVSRGRLFPSGRIDDLRAREILRIDPGLVRRLVRTSADSSVPAVSVVYGRERRQWNVELPKGGGSADVDGIERVLSTLNPLTAVRIERLQVPASGLAAYGLETPCLVLAVDQDREDAVRRNLLIGDRCSGGRYATVGSADAVFVISDDDLERISESLIRN